MAVEGRENGLGIRSMVMYYEPVYNSSYRDVAAYRSQLRLNTELGVLLPAQYQDIALRSSQAVRLARYALDIVSADANKLRNRDVFCEWLSFYMPLKLLSKPELIDYLKAAIEKNDIIPKDLCLELPGELLYEDAEETAPVLEKLSDLGVKTMLTDIGSEFSPLMRLMNFKTDYILLDRKVTDDMLCMEDEEKEFLMPVIEAMASGGRTLIASGINSEADAKLFSPKCVMSVGKLAGRPKKAGSIRP